MSHLMLSPGSRIVDMGCDNGSMTYTMAVMHPDLNFTGIDQNPKNIKHAKKHFQRDNLEFVQGDIRKNADLEEEQYDAVVNSFILYEIFSQTKYNEQAVINTLQNQFKLLKKDGVMFIRDYSMPSPGSYVMLEMPDKPSINKELKNMSEADLLVWYSENARPGGLPGCNGFFLEELPPRFPQTRLFRLPYKWAYEFIMRKDDRNNWAQDLPKEYTFFTQREYRKNLRSLGARVLYTAPHWDDKLIRDKFEGHFRLYDDYGKPLGAPPTSFIAVSQKRDEQDSLCLHERRPSTKIEGQIKISSMRDEASGNVVDLVCRDTDITEILPYRITPEGELRIFVHDGLPRSLTNAIPRIGREIDGKRWSGHMTEALSVPTDVIAAISDDNQKDTVKFARDYIGLKPADGCTLEMGQSYYPAPDTIDELIKTRYLRVSASEETSITPRKVMDEISGFTTTGQIKEIKAQSLLNAIAVGFIPNARLELQIQTLMNLHGIQAESWSENPMALETAAAPEEKFDSEKFARSLLEDDKRYRNVRGTTGKLRSVKSIFIDEGWIDGGIVGLAAQNKEFIVSSGETLNKATVMPLTNDLDGKLQAGFVTEYMPVPQRQKGNGLTMTLPCFSLPKDVESVEDARKYIAQLYDVPLDAVFRLGESYYSHVGVTPERIFPFAIANKGKKDNPTGGPFQYAPVSYLWTIMFLNWDWPHNVHFMSRISNVYKLYLHDSDLAMTLGHGKRMSAEPHTPRIHKAVDIAGRAEMSSPATSGAEHSGEAANTSVKPNLGNLKIVDSDADSVWRPASADLLDSRNIQENAPPTKQRRSKRSKVAAYAGGRKPARDDKKS